MVSYKQKYRDLLEEKKRLAQNVDSLSESRRMRYTLVCKNIANIDQPVSSDFLSKVAYVKENEVDLNGLSFFRDFLFSDGTSVFLWYSSLVNYYLEGKMKEEEVANFLDMYKCSLKVDDFTSTILYLQMVLKKVNRNLFCDFLGIKTCLYVKLCKLHCEKNIIINIINYLSNKDFSSFSELQKKEIDSFLCVLKEKSEEAEEKISVNNISEEKMQNRIVEILQYIRIHKVSTIPSNVPFSDGENMESWYAKNLRHNDFTNNVPELAEIKKRGAYQIAKELYNSSTVSLHKEISIDYGSSLRRVAAIYCFSSEKLSSIFKMPKRFLLQIMKNKLIPTEEFIACVLSFLKSLSVSDTYQREFVDNAILSYEQLKDMHLEGDKLTFVFYPAEKEVEYLKLWKDFDSTILAQVKSQNYDWYLKCLTIYYIFNKRNGVPTKEDFFYDGSVANKWLINQQKSLMGEIEFLSKEQVTMLDRIDTLLINRKYDFMCKNDKETILSTAFDAVYQALSDSLEKYGDISSDVFYENVSLKTLWNYLGKKLESKKTPCSHDQIVKIKELRRKVIYNQKKQNKCYGSHDINFDYELACFLDSLHISFGQAPNLLGISQGALAEYSRGTHKPRVDIIDRMLSSLDKLNLESYRADQIQDIEHFRQILLTLHNKKSLIGEDFVIEKALRPMDITFLTGNLLEDIPTSYLQEIENTDNLWYQKFKKLYELIFQSMNDEKAPLIELKSREWIITEIYKIYDGESIPIKKELLSYLYYLNQKARLKRREIRFVKNFTILENFIYENKRVPDLEELSLFDTDGQSFYSMIRDSVYGTKDYYRDFSAYLQEQMKLIIQYIALCQREKQGYRKDRIKEGRFFLGERITALRICLGFSRNVFMKKIGWDNQEMHAIYSNRKYLTEKQIQELLHLFKEMESEKLRKDQLEEIQNFILVLTTKKLEDGFYLKFSPKE